ncbi:hypothetical protein LR48_Vigan567s000300 [Vigna angularis]|uniref:Uncharacterized protein n=1 Tax=Phaseolus angularis TaxID=3914 RepID=A0A0L9TDY5_PHAAN|nr:hypothetical protein LR48_Vigan567s000300 [Vigna angularis]
MGSTNWGRERRGREWEAPREVDIVPHISLHRRLRKPLLVTIYALLPFDPNRNVHRDTTHQGPATTSDSITNIAGFIDVITTPDSSSFFVQLTKGITGDASLHQTTPTATHIQDLEWICTVMVFLYLVVVFQMFQKIVLDIEEDAHFLPMILEKFRRGGGEGMDAGLFNHTVQHFGYRKPQLASVFGELLVDSHQLLMVIVATSLQEIGYEIQLAKSSMSL